MVFVDVSDPIGPGFIESVARPGGDTTGMLSFEAGVIGKWLAMLKEIAPSLARVMMLGNSRTTAFEYFLRAATAAAPSLGNRHCASPGHHRPRSGKRRWDACLRPRAAV